MTQKMFLLFCFFATNFCFSQQKFHNLQEAQTEVSKTDKTILMVFSGSDWCLPCIKLRKNILDSEEFKNFEKEKLVFLEVDFPKKKKNKLTNEQQKINNELAEKYNKEGIFPKILLLSKDGKILANFGYENTNPQAYIQKIKTYLK